ncbi:tetratricopeptide repeat protein [Acinetobacter rudis]|uniref:Tetratricopeptide repeat protein n=1 Tax=Acinetobacter rudis TaxID=632955 RepID=A0AAW8JB45_9GAMM|nr:tetratricopeptide repeat protein [Acinetobacter rudis]MDQ8935886.1 tetratricopeptide repeat protein [Acinetobacter rudis]MDQ8953669.1 tetratricopeptide repeat protein [Acinetobacter rudis]MDQ9018149.1 tetratricopeptide repeat protein [Acinetobacter rudis]
MRVSHRQLIILKSPSLNAGGFFFIGGKYLPRKYEYRAARAGDSHSQLNLGQRYRTGAYVQQNFKIAYQWYLKAAQQFYVPAYNEIGLLYAQGAGVQQDYILAYAWISLASQQNNTQAKLNLKKF